MRAGRTVHSKQREHQTAVRSCLGEGVFVALALSHNFCSNRADGRPSLPIGERGNSPMSTRSCLPADGLCAGKPRLLGTSCLCSTRIKHTRSRCRGWRRPSAVADAAETRCSRGSSRSRRPRPCTTRVCVFWTRRPRPARERVNMFTGERRRAQQQTAGGPGQLHGPTCTAGPDGEAEAGNLTRSRESESCVRSARARNGGANPIIQRNRFRRRSTTWKCSLV